MSGSASPWAAVQGLRDDAPSLGRVGEPALDALGAERPDSEDGEVERACGFGGQQPGLKLEDRGGLARIVDSGVKAPALTDHGDVEARVAALADLSASRRPWLLVAATR